MADREGCEFSAWNPGLEAELPRRYQPLETIHRPANVYSRLSDIPELRALTGLTEEELVAFRPERLVLHELIVQVTADVVVLEGEEEELLGQHFRRIALRILSGYLTPYMPAFQQAYDRLYDEIHSRVRIFSPRPLPPSRRRSSPSPARGCPGGSASARLRASRRTRGQSRSVIMR